MIYLFLLLLISLIALMFGYPTLIYLFYYREKTKYPKNVSKDFNSKVTLIIPTVAGGKIMESKFENTMNLNYPLDKIDIIVIDSSNKLFSVPEGVKVIHQERMGKPAALNKGIEVSNNEIIVMTDDDAILDSDSLTRLVSIFSDPNIGGVVGDITIVGKGRLNQMNSSFYSFFRNSLRKWESALDSISFASGELFGFRKSIVSKIDPKVLSDDLYLLFEIRKKGYRVVSSDAKVFEEDVPSLWGQINHKRRTMIGTLQVFYKNINMIFNIRYGLFGTIIAPMYLLRITLCPFLLLALEVLFIIQFQLLIPFIPIVLLLVYLVKKSLASALIYGLITQIAALLGMIDFMIGNYRVGWTKKGK